MEALVPTLAATVAISLLAWIGVLALYLRDDLLDRLVLGLVALAAGALIGGAFFHLLPEAIAEVGLDAMPSVFLVVVAGFSAFYVLEALLGWHHHHAGHEHEPVTTLVLVSDALHNFVDGVLLAGAFAAAVPLGLTTAGVVALHEIPQELGDFGVLVYGGYDRRRALVLNYLAQTSVVAGGVVGVFFAGAFAGVVAYLLAFAAGHFVYVASSDLVPELRDDDVGRSLGHFGVFLVGVGLMWALTLLPAE